MLRLLLIGFLLVSCTPNFKENRLNKELSPYLKQHAKNPVWWQPWTDETLKYAKKENKLIFLSVGYSTCHWCHVMERDVFEKEEFAKVANRDFVAIKVDREEKPDLDAYFMKALQGITRGGGWPMTLVLTPDLLPVFGSTYVPLDKMVYILEELQKAWIEKREELVKRGQLVADWVHKEAPSDLSFEKDQELLKKFFAHYKQVYDPHFGGKKGRVKFPLNTDLRILLRYYLRTKKSQALQMVNRTLEYNIQSGLFDHLGGGFHRYATDPRWQVPHFEKMLYDQASFLHTLIEAQQTNIKPIYMRAIVRTMDFLLNEMKSPEGGFYSALDADSEGVEGKFYTWRSDEIKKALTEEEYKEFNRVFNVTHPKKELENRRVIIHKVVGEKPETAKVVEKLKKTRDQRTRPHTDKKVITAWNGLVLSALAKLGRFWPSTSMDDIVNKNLQYILKEHQSTFGNLARLSLDGKTSGQAALDDYAFLIDALIEAYQTTFEEDYLLQARKLQRKQDDLFLDQSRGNYRYSQANGQVYDKYKVWQDNVRPSGQAMTVWNLIRLSHYFLDPNLEMQYKRLMNSFPDDLESSPQAFSFLLLSVDYLTGHPKELVIAGSKAQCKKAIHEISQAFFPFILFSCNFNSKSQLPLAQKKTKIDEKATFYVCEKGSCKLPTTNFLEAKKQLLKQ